MPVPATQLPPRPRSDHGTVDDSGHHLRRQSAAAFKCRHTGPHADFSFQACIHGQLLQPPCKSPLWCAMAFKDALPWILLPAACIVSLSIATALVPVSPVLQLVVISPCIVWMGAVASLFLQHAGEEVRHATRPM